MSDNLKKYKAAFKETFDLKNENLESLEYQSIDDWDSIGHMTLMSELESAFSITLETDDIIDFSSFKKGKEIIVPANSWISSSEAVTRNGLKVVFADINNDDYTLDLKKIERYITKNTSAIIAVHLYGHPCNLKKILFIKSRFAYKTILKYRCLFKQKMLMANPKPQYSKK